MKNKSNISFQKELTKNFRLYRSIQKSIQIILYLLDTTILIVFKLYLIVLVFPKHEKIIVFLSLNRTDVRGGG